MDYTDYQHILFERRDHGILWLTLNRPEVLNAADARLHTEFVHVWQTIDRDPAVRVARISSDGLSSGPANSSLPCWITSFWP